MEVTDIGFLMLALPRTLTHLEGIYVKETKFVALLPRTLRNCDFLRYFRKFTPALARALPPNLESVYCSRMGRRSSLSIDTQSFVHEQLDYQKSLPGLLMLVMEQSNAEEAGSTFDPAFVAFKKLPKTKPQIFGSYFII